MQYEQTEVKPSNGAAISNKVMVNAAKRLSTMRLLYIIIARHKVGILLAGNAILVLNFVFPPWFAMVLGLMGK